MIYITIKWLFYKKINFEFVCCYTNRPEYNRICMSVYDAPWHVSNDTWQEAWQTLWQPPLGARLQITVQSSRCSLHALEDWKLEVYLTHLYIKIK